MSIIAIAHNLILIWTCYICIMTITQTSYSYRPLHFTSTHVQMTRDKNGIYVDPAMFYGMEQRIAAQDAQIVEVEGVLKSKMEEVKEAKAQKEEYVSYFKLYKRIII